MPSLEVTPCEAEPKNVGKNFAKGPRLSKIHRGLWRQFKSCFRHWRIAKNGGAT